MFKVAQHFIKMRIKILGAPIFVILIDLMVHRISIKMYIKNNVKWLKFEKIKQSNWK